MIEEKLASIGIRLPESPSPIGSYLPVVTAANMAYVSGQIPIQSGKLTFKGKVGRDITIESGQEAAKLCTINALAQLKSFLGSLDEIERFVKVTGFVNCEASFTDHAKVMNGASDFIFQIFGEKGRHTRTAIGVSSLPLDSSVEVDFLVQLKRQTS